jgi:hypothetical protein
MVDLRALACYSCLCLQYIRCLCSCAIDLRCVRFHRINPWSESVSKLYRPKDRRLSGNIMSNFADRGCYVLSAAYPYGRTLDFLDQSRYFFFQVAPQLNSRGWVDSVPYPLLLRKFGGVGNRTSTSGSVARNSDHWTTEAVFIIQLLRI